MKSKKKQTEVSYDKLFPASGVDIIDYIHWKRLCKTTNQFF